jgi:hypothetical protein
MQNAFSMREKVVQPMKKFRPCKLPMRVKFSAFNRHDEFMYDGMAMRYNPNGKLLINPDGNGELFEIDDSFVEATDEQD